jgi:hypothetical protein
LSSSSFFQQPVKTPGQAAASDYEMIADADFVLDGPDGESMAAR